LSAGGIISQENETPSVTQKTDKKMSKVADDRKTSKEELNMPFSLLKN